MWVGVGEWLRLRLFGGGGEEEVLGWAGSASRDFFQILLLLSL